MTIRDAMLNAGFNPDIHELLPRDERESLDFFQEWPTTVHCGEECLRILKAGIPLLEAVDPACTVEVWTAIVSGMSVICVG